MRTDYFIGIDPGRKGGLAIIETRDLKPYKLTLTVYKIEEYVKIFSKLQGVGNVHIMIEYVHGWTKDFAKSAFAFGKNTGIVYGIVYSFGFSLQEVDPNRWMREYNMIEKGKKHEKEQSIKVAKYLYGKDQPIDLRSSNRATYDHDGIAEALLIAEWGRRQWERQ